MSSKGKSPDDKAKRAQTKTNIQSVSPDSLQTQAPGAVQRGSANVQSVSAEEQGSTARDRGSLPDSPDAEAQQQGWSARQQADRNEARNEELRNASPQQSGYGGKEQKQRAGAQESVNAPQGSEQSARPERPGSRDDPPSDAGSRHTERTTQR